MIFYRSDREGCVYAALDGALVCTPLFQDLTFDTCLDNWDEVDIDHAIAEGLNPEGIYKRLVLCEEMC